MLGPPAGSVGEGTAGVSRGHCPGNLPSPQGFALALPKPSPPSLAPQPQPCLGSLRASGLAQGPGSVPHPALAHPQPPQGAGAAARGRGTHEWGSPARGSRRGLPPARKGSPYPAFRLSIDSSTPSHGMEAPGGRGRGRVSKGSHHRGSGCSGGSWPGAAAEPGAALGWGCSPIGSFLLLLQELFHSEVPCPQKASPGLVRGVSPRPGGSLPRKQGPWAG